MPSAWVAIIRFWIISPCSTPFMSTICQRSKSPQVDRVGGSSSRPDSTNAAQRVVAELRIEDVVAVGPSKYRSIAVMHWRVTSETGMNSVVPSALTIQWLNLNRFGVRRGTSSRPS